MSVFRGSIAEYPGVIIDHFIPANCERGRIFFLSHCHRDHMTGLSSPNITSALKKLHTHLFCSEVTRSLLLKDPDFTQLAPYLRGLPMEEPVVMSIDSSSLHEKLNFTVTLLPAGHCPGSSMFFFQGSKGNVLYTGDFRLTLEETKRLHPLRCGDSVLDIKTLYVDTTFCHPLATDIPSRDTSRDLILKLIESWLAKSTTNVVHLQCAMFGYEHLYMGVYKKFKSKVHIAPWRINAYKEIAAVTDCLTTDGESTRIHACNYRKGQKGCQGLPCGSCNTNGSPNVLRVKPSTQWFLFNGKSTSHPCVFLPQFNKFRVIHSMHASYSELQDFITYIKPKRIVPCVIPSGDSSLTDVCRRLKGLVPLTEVTGIIQTSQKGDRRKCTTNKKSVEHTTDSDDDWSTGDESIDEFTSTEEQPSAESTATFCHGEKSKVEISLPSLISLNEDDTSPPPSTDSATLGSLRQSPIDLSLSTPGSASTSQNTLTEICPPTTTRFTKDEGTGKLLHGSDTSVLNKGKAGAANDGKIDKSDEWCLKYECSPPTCSTNSAITPPTKKARLSESSVSRKLFEGEILEKLEQDPTLGTHDYIDLTQDEQSSEQSDCIPVSAPDHIVDLTQDHQSPSQLQSHELSGEHTVSDDVLSTETHTDTLASINQNFHSLAPLVVVELSDSSTGSTVGSTGCRSASVESGTFGSPSCLPPTPGRENICSILQRPDFP